MMLPKCGVLILLATLLGSTSAKKLQWPVESPSQPVESNLADEIHGEGWSQWSERHTVLWHQKYNLPVTTRGHNFMNPNTGLLEHANPNEIISGPPSIDIYVHNLAAHPEESGQFSLRAAAVGTVNEVVAEIGAQVARGAYSIYSLNVSKYQVTLIIESEMRYAELGEELSGIARKVTKQSFERSKKAVQDAKTIIFRH